MPVKQEKLLDMRVHVDEEKDLVFSKLIILSLMFICCIVLIPSQIRGPHLHTKFLVGTLALKGDYFIVLRL